MICSMGNLNIILQYIIVQFCLHWKCRFVCIKKYRFDCMKYQFYRATAAAVAAPKKKDRKAKLHYITRQHENVKVPIFSPRLCASYCDLKVLTSYMHRSHRDLSVDVWTTAKFDLEKKLWIFENRDFGPIISPSASSASSSCFQRLLACTYSPLSRRSIASALHI